MKTKDKSRKWMWWLLGVVGSLQLYFVRELLAAFALFLLGFSVIAAIVMGLYLLQKSWETGLALLLASQNSFVLFARRSMTFAEELARRPIRRTGPEVPSNI